VPRSYDPTGFHTRGVAPVGTLGACLVAVTLILLGASSRAAGRDDDKLTCVKASEQAQLERLHGKLRSARDQLLTCARDACPPLVRTDCGRWLTEIDASLPTVVISALDTNGHDVGNVRVEVDGAAFLDQVGGSAVPVDPGDHTFVFRHGSDPAVSQKVIIREGEKNRILAVRFGTTALPSAAVAPPGAEVGVTAPEARSPIPIVGWSLIAAGAIGLGLGAYFEITQVKDFNDLENTCGAKGQCMTSQVTPISNDRVYGAVSLAAGIAAAGVGVTLLLLHRSKHEPSQGNAPTGVSIDVAPSRGGGAAVVQLQF
jgi:hypothetical protein